MEVRRHALVTAVEDAAQHLATRLEIEVDGAGDEERLRTAALQMAAGILRQASGSVASLHGRPVDVNVRVRVDGRSVLMHSGSLRVVPERALLAKLASALEGTGRVRVLGGFVPQREKPRWKTRRPETADAN